MISGSSSNSLGNMSPAAFLTRLVAALIFGVIVFFASMTLTILVREASLASL